MKQQIVKLLSRVIKFCPKTGRPVKALNKWIVPLFSVLAFIWILIRVIPKPQRVYYPCMKVAIPFAAPLFIYISSFWASVVIYKKSFRKFSQAKYSFAGLLLIAGLGFTIITIAVDKQYLFANTTGVEAEYNYVDPLGPNQPIGQAKGIIPGRVVWAHNPDATNGSCKPDVFGDGYFLDKNANQEKVDEMLSSAILSVTGAETEEEAWGAIFTYFNSTHNKGEVGYKDGEKIFIKINAVHAWNTENDLSIKNDDDYGKVDTSPQVILAVLRQLINKAGVPQEAIYIGDPITDIFKHLHDKLSADFPDIHYMSDEEHDKREKLQHTNTAKIKFSDKGTALDVLSDTHYDCVVSADYVLNIPAIKGHRGAGATVFAKNHFGTHTQETAAHMHPGLVAAGGAPRHEYRQYRVLVDLMAYKHLGGKTLIYIGDFLWGTSMEHDPPVKFRSPPFNFDWTSSILVSLDPVAIASVSLDILQEEFQIEEKNLNPPRYIYVRFTAVDDYLHQAASDEWWPEGITYDPDDSGTPIESLGVHEHWNNPDDKQYSRNLKTGDGIELVYQNLKLNSSVGNLPSNSLELKTYISGGNSILNIECNENIQEKADVRIYNISGQLMQVENIEAITKNIPEQIALKNYTPGYYVVTLSTNHVHLSKTIVIN